MNIHYIQNIFMRKIKYNILERKKCNKLNAQFNRKTLITLFLKF